LNRQYRPENTRKIAKIAKKEKGFRHKDSENTEENRVFISVIFVSLW